jgi:hypothetical protein
MKNISHMETKWERTLRLYESYWILNDSLISLKWGKLEVVIILGLIFLISLLGTLTTCIQKPEIFFLYFPMLISCILKEFHIDKI